MKRLLSGPRGEADPEAFRAAVDGRVVVVTGASHGIGEALARRLGAAGARTVLVARSADRLTALADELGPGAVALPCDLADRDAVATLPAAVLDAHGEVDIVVSNAGHSIKRSVAASAERLHDVTRLADVNYVGPAGLLLGLLPAMRARGRGHIVNVSTVGVLLPPAPSWGPYVASKGAFDTWLRSAAAEIAADGVTTTSVYFGLVHTRMSAPSREFAEMPGLSADEAAGVLARAIVQRPLRIAPWWATAVGVASAAARRPAAAAMRRYGAAVRS